MNSWTLMCGPWNAGPQLDLTRLATWKLSAKRRDPSTLSFDMNGSDPDLTIRELIDDVWLWCDGQIVSRCRVTGVSDDLSDGHSLSVAAIDYRGVLSRRLIWDDWTLSRTNVDPAEDSWQLVVQAQAEPGGSVGVSRGVSPAPAVTVAEIKHEAGNDVAGEIDTNAKLGDGFDWDVTPTDETHLQFDVWRPGRGRVTDVVFAPHLGTPGRQVDSVQYGNAVRLPGGADSAGNQLAAVRREAGDIASRPEGRWDLAVQDTGTTSTASTAAARADNALSAAQVLQPSYTFDLNGAWGGPADFWVGDTVTVQIRSGRLLIDEQLSVEAIDATGDPDLPDPKVTVTLGAYTFQQAQRLRLRQIDRTLGTLSRR